MGDRCYMTLTIGGDIDTVEKFDAMITALKEEGASDINSGRNAIRQAFVIGLASGHDVQFEFDEVNYANLDCFETLSALGLDLVAYHGAGGEYGAGMETYDGTTRSRYEWAEADEEMISMRTIEGILKEEITAEEQIAKIKGTISDTRDSQWNDPRPFTVSGAAADALAAEVARYKIEKAAA